MPKFRIIRRVEINSQATAKYIALGVVTVATCGTAAFSRSFVKIQVGPLYMLEFLYILWLLFACWSISRGSFRSFLGDSTGAISFFLWGLALVLVDLCTHSFHSFIISFPRITQHGLLFVYPLLWIAVGY